MFILFFVLMVSAAEVVVSQKPSPCPQVFTYEKGHENETDRWYGVIMLKADEDISGIDVHVSLDRTAHLIGNWFGISTSSDNKEFVIKNASHALKAGETLSVRFFIKYNSGGKIPSLQSIKFNGRNICKDNTHIESSTSVSSNDNNNNTPRRPNSKPYIDFRPKPRPVLVDDDYNSETPTSRPPNVSRKSDPGSVDFVDDYDDEPDTSGEYIQGVFESSGPILPVRNPVRNTKGSQCGKVTARPNALISHAQGTSAGEWPWHVALYYFRNAALTYVCGGTLISERHIVTAAHCVTKARTRRPIKLNVLLAFLGKYNLKKFGPEVQDKEISKIYVHPDYNATNFFNDIAILKLDEPAKITNYVRPCCLWEEAADFNSVSDRLGTVIGWGFDENNQPSIELMKASMPVVTTATCHFSDRDFFPHYTSEKTFCAGSRNGTTVCNGDSGGGMFYPKRRSINGEIAWQIRGIVSVGMARQGEATCNPSHYAIFTDIAKHLDWVERIMETDIDN